MTTTTRARMLVGKSSGTAARSATMSACTRPRSSSTAAHGRPSGSGDWSDAGAAERGLRQPAIPARQVLLLDQHRCERGGHARVVRRLRVALQPQRLRHAACLLAGGVALALGGGGGDLGLALRLDELVAL